MHKKLIRSFLTHNLHSPILWIAGLVLVAACANMGSPDGGAYDETPPKIISTTPEYGAVGAKQQVIELVFDENIKIQNAAEKVIVSPPQMEQPEISTSGRRIRVELVDSMKPNMTYTIDFADAIEDNNEGNPMGNYAFTFSTGETIDTMQVSGYVLDAQNLEPIKGIFVGMYAVDTLAESFSDTIFRTKPFERISRTDSRGHFVVKGLKPCEYRIFALKDQDQTYSYTQKSEMLAFSDQKIISTCKPALRPDTIWHDSLHYDSIIMRSYTHFYPDDIALLAFTEPTTERYLLKTERPNLHEFTIYFTSKSDSLPTIEGLNFDVENAFVIDANPTNDTIKYWIRDSLVYNLDTLEIVMSFMGTDTLGQLTLQTDTMELVSRISKAKVDKQKQEAWDNWVKEAKEEAKKARKRAKAEGNTENNTEEVEEDTTDKKRSKKEKKNDEEEIEIPPMPEEFMGYRTSSSTMAPDQNFDFLFSEPIEILDTALIHFYEKVDSILEPRPYIIRQLEYPHHAYRLFAEWEPGHNYVVELDTGAFVSIYGKRVEAYKRAINVRGNDSFSSLFVTLQGVDSCAIVQLMNPSDKVIKTVPAEKNKAEFYYIDPGTYYLRVFIDRNRNGVWDPGDYDQHRQAEEVYYYPGSFKLRAMWDTTQDWNPLSTPVYRQKPAAITKQKPDKEKTSKTRNAEREKNKRQQKKRS